MDKFVGILVAVLVLSIIVMVHEFGHFIFAKINGIAVEEFAIGMGPKLIKKKFKETEFSIRLFPIGGLCKVLGEDQKIEEDGVIDERSFSAKPVFARMQVILGGAIFNFLLAFVVSLIYIGNVGTNTTVISGVVEDAPAAVAGMQKGDKIVEINGKHVLAYREISMYINENPGADINMVFKRDGEKIEKTITPYEENGSYKIGVYPTAANTKNVFTLIKYAGTETVLWIKMVFYSLSLLFHGTVSVGEVSGPVGIFAVTSEGYQATVQYGIGPVLNFLMFLTILLSANLGVMNLLPIPALDGGRFIFLLIEAVRGKPINPEKEGMVHFIGFMLLMVIMVLVMFNDVRKFLF